MGVSNKGLFTNSLNDLAKRRIMKKTLLKTIDNRLQTEKPA